MVLKGPEPPHTGNVLVKHASWVLGGSFFERLAYYTVTGSLTVFFTKQLNFEAVLAQQMQALQQSIVYLMPIVGAFIADTLTGRYVICLVSLLVAGLGAAGLMAGDLTNQAWLCLLSLFILFSLPISMVKPNLIVLGGDQFNEKYQVQIKQRDAYFSCLYASTNIAAATAFLVMNQIAVEGMGAVKKEWSFSFVFLMGAILATFSFGCLLLGSKFLYAPKPKGSPLKPFIQVTKAALKKSSSKNGIAVIVGMALLMIAVLASIPSFFLDAPALDYTLAVIIIVACGLLIIFGRDSNWIAHAEVTSPGIFSEDQIQGAKDVFQLAPYIAFAIPFWGVYNQMNTSFISQGCQMNNAIGDFRLAPSTLPTFNSIVIVIIIPILNLGVYPCMTNIAGGKWTLTPLRRIGVGFIVCCLAMIMAAVCEYARRGTDILMAECDAEAVTLGWCTNAQLGLQVPELSSCYDYTDGRVHVPKRNMSIFWQIIPYGLIGAAEVFVAVSYYDFFYSQVPMSMRSVCQSLQMLTTSLGTMVGAVINSICATWIPNNLDFGNQEYVYFMNMGFVAAAFVIFVFVSPGFKYKPGTSLLPGDTVDKSEDDKDDDEAADEDGAVPNYEYYYEDDEKVRKVAQ